MNKYLLGTATGTKTATESRGDMAVLNDRLMIALATIRERANKVYQMGDAEARRALCDIYAFANDVLLKIKTDAAERPEPIVDAATNANDIRPMKPGHPRDFYGRFKP